MIITGKTLLELSPIKDMLDRKVTIPELGSYGLTETGYDIRLAQEVIFDSISLKRLNEILSREHSQEEEDKFLKGMTRLKLGSAIEEFQLPSNLCARVGDKSSNARRGFTVLNTTIQPGWGGFLTIEIGYFGYDKLVIPKGTPIASVIFEEVSDPLTYRGLYQEQEASPQEARTYKGSMTHEQYELGLKESFKTYSSIGNSASGFIIPELEYALNAYIDAFIALYRTEKCSQEVYRTKLIDLGRKGTSLLVFLEDRHEEVFNRVDSELEIYVHLFDGIRSKLSKEQISDAELEHKLNLLLDEVDYYYNRSVEQQIYK